MKTVTIHLETWDSPNNPYNKSTSDQAGLFRLRHGYCCLGFVCLAHGIDKETMKAASMPDDLDEDPIPNFSFCEEAAKVNDDTFLSFHKKLDLLSLLATKHNYRFLFVTKNWIVIHDSLKTNQP